MPDAFKGLSLQVNPPRQSDYRDRLQKWGLWDPYVAVMEETTRAGLPTVLAASLREAMERGNLQSWLEEFEGRHRDLGNSGAAWKELYTQCVIDALESAFAAALSPTKGKTLVSRSIETELREVLAWSVDYVSAPVWLDDNVVQKLNDLRLAHLLSEVSVLKKRDLASATQRAALARSLLEIAHVWTNHSPTPAHYAAINRLAAEIPKNERRNFPVGLAACRT